MIRNAILYLDEARILSQLRLTHDLAQDSK